MPLSKPKFPSQLFSEHFELKLIRELVALQHRQSTGEEERMGFFAHALSNHNGTILGQSLFSRSITASCTEQLFNLVSLCYDEHNKDYAAFKAVVLKLFGAKGPFDTMQIKKDLKNFPTEVWNQHNKEVMMYCFFKCCYYDEEQFKQCMHFARQRFDPTTMSSCNLKEEALVVECMQCGGTARTTTYKLQIQIVVVAIERLVLP